MTVIVSDMSIKNQVAILITYIYVHDKSIIKTLHHTINITSNETELFTIRCSINQAIQLDNINCIVIITDLIHMAKRIFDSSIHSYQVQTSAIFQKLRDFFNKDHHNSIKLWKCLSRKR